MYWFNNCFSNLTRSILFPGGAGASETAPIAHMNGVPTPQALDHPSSGNNGPSRSARRDDDDGYDRDAAARAAAYDRLSRLRGNERYRDDGDFRDYQGLDNPAGNNNSPARPKDKSKEPPAKTPGGIFGKVPILPMGAPKK